MSEEKKPADSSPEDEDLTEEELADVTAGAGAVMPRKVQEAATIEKKWAPASQPGSSEILRKDGQ